MSQSQSKNAECCCGCSPKETECTAQGNTLSSLKPGGKAIIAGYKENCKSSYKMKLLSLGLTKGTKVLEVKTAPLGDPMEIELRGYRLSLRKHEADAVLIETEGL